MERAPVHGIEVFLTIVREGSLRAAAKALGVGAPAVSIQLKALEEKMGVGLLFRSTRSIELTDAGRVLFEAAAPAYLERHGRPDHPRDLLDHRCIRYRAPTANKIAGWHFTEDGQDKVIDPPARLVFDHMVGVIQAACDGHGIGWSLRATVAEHLRSGALETVLDSYASVLPPFYLYYPEQNRRVECLRLLIDCLVSYRDRQAEASA